MRLPTLATLLTLSLTTLASAADLGIEVTHAVECTRKTQNGDTVSMHYRGKLASDGSEFDASYNRGTPLKFKLGSGRVIKGYVFTIFPPLLACFGEELSMEMDADLFVWV